MQIEPNHNNKTLVLGPGIEDNGMRGLGVVTLSLIEGLALAGKETFLLTGAPIKNISSKNPGVKNAAARRCLDHYLVDGYKSSAFELSKLYIAKYIIKDLISIIIGKVQVLPLKHNLDLRHEPVELKRFSKLSNFVNFAFIYKFTSKLPLRIRSAIIFAIAKRVGAGTIITASPYPLAKPIFNKKKSPKIIQYIHDVMPLNILETPPDSVDKFSLSLDIALLNADKVLVSSYNAKDKLKILYPDIKTQVAYLPCKRSNIVDQTNFSAIKNYNLKKNDYFLFMSALEKRKNVKRLLQAFEMYARNHKTKLVLVGSSGYGWEEIDNQIKLMDVKTRQNITLAGYVPEEEKWNLIDNCLAVVHPAIDEGLGIPVIEGIIAAKPVISTRLNSVEEISPPGCVTYIENAYDTYEIAEKLNFISNSKNINHRAINTASNLLKERFSMTKFSERLIKITNG